VYRPAGTESIDDSQIGAGVGQVQYQGNWISAQGRDGEGDMQSTTSGASYDVRFEGTQALLYGDKGPDLGMETVSVDNGIANTVDLYSPNPQHDVLIFATPTVQSGLHTLVVRNTGRVDSNELTDGSGSFLGLVPSERVVVVPDNSLLVNSDFSTGDLTGWQGQWHPSYAGVEDGYPYDGTYDGYLHPQSNGDVGMDQTVTAPVTGTYTLTARGAIYGLPDRGGYSMIFFNKALFRAAHIPYPTSDWTWADFLRDAQKMTIVKDGKTVQWGFAGSGWWPYFGALVHEAGGNFINANETSGTVSSPATQAGLNFANDLAFKWHVTPTPVEAANFGANGPNIARGNIGMNMDSFWDIKTLYASLGQNLGMAPFPKDKTGGMETVGTGVAIAAQSKYIQADWDFLQWLSTPAGQRQIVINHEDMPATKYGLSLWIKTLPKGLSYSLLAPDAKDVFSPRIPPTWTQLQTVEGNDLTPFWDGKTTIAALAPKLDQDISGVLNSGQ